MLSDPRTVPVTRQFPAVAGTFFPTTALSNVVDFIPTPPGSAGFPAPTSPDSAYMPPPPSVPVADPNARRFKMFIDLLSDFVFGAGGSVDTTLAANENWTVDIALPPAVVNEIASVCVQSFRFGASLGEFERLVLPAHGAFVEDTENPDQSACEVGRPGLDVVLVLDRSGSMGGSTLGAPLARRSRRCATPWTTSCRPGTMSVSASFQRRQLIGSAWCSSTPRQAGGRQSRQPASSTLPLLPPRSRRPTLRPSHPGARPPSEPGCELADAAFGPPDPTRRRVVLLMSNGQQNTAPFVGVTPGLPHRVFTHPSGTTTGPDLPNQDSYQIYTVTVGTGAAVSAQINEDIASATQGFYVNSEVSAESLRTYFIELLQNFVRFNTWETARLVQGQVTPLAPLDTSFPISTTTTRVAIHALWPEQFDRLRMQVFVPGEASPREEFGSGAIRFSMDVPTAAPYDPIGSWRVVISGFFNSEVGAGPSNVPVELTVLTDDRAVNADLSVVSRAYAPGDNIQLQAAVTEFGRPLLGLGTNAGETVVAQVLKPGTSIGDLLSSSTASTTPPANGDIQTPAEARLFNELQRNPGALTQTTDLVTLLDNGQAANGDTSAGDGIYSGLYPTNAPGHYTFLFGVQGRTREAGYVSRQQVKTVFVRAIPDGGTTQAQTSVQTVDGRNILTIQITPRTRFSNLLGPGFANYLWFTSPGSQPFKPVDNLNGTFTATLAFSGSVPPPVTFHFLPVSIHIDDSVQPNNLPVPLDEATTVIETLPGTGTGGGKATGCLLILIGLLTEILQAGGRALEALSRLLRP